MKTFAFRLWQVLATIGTVILAIPVFVLGAICVVVPVGLVTWIFVDVMFLGGSGVCQPSSDLC